MLFFWRRHPDLNRGIKVLQTFALPLGYSALFLLFPVKAVSFYHINNHLSTVLCYVLYYFFVTFFPYALLFVRHNWLLICENRVAQVGKIGTVAIKTPLCDIYHHKKTYKLQNKTHIQKRFENNLHSCYKGVLYGCQSTKGLQESAESETLKTIAVDW